MTWIILDAVDTIVQYTIIQLILRLILNNTLHGISSSLLCLAYGLLDYKVNLGVMAVYYIPPFQVVDIGGERLLEAGERNFCRLVAGRSPLGLTGKIRTDVVRSRSK